MGQKRQKKLEAFKDAVEKENPYLFEHKRLKVEAAKRRLLGFAKKLNLEGWVEIAVQDREFEVVLDEGALKKETELDGCYVIKTNLPKDRAEAETVHRLYKDLAKVERAF